MVSSLLEQYQPKPALDTLPRCTWSHAAHLARVFLAESLGMGLIMFIIVIYQPGDNPSVSSSCVVGAAFAWVICVMGPISGAQVNPSVSLALLLTRRLSVIHAVISVIAQFVGATCGVLLGRVAGPPNVTDVPNVGMTLRNPAITVGQAVGLEVFGTIVLVGLVLSVADEFRSHPWSQGHLGVFPLMFGVMIFLLATAVGPYTGGSMNPALSLGAAVANRNFTEVWIYVIGPTVGSILVTIFYEALLSDGASWPRLKALLTESDFDRNKNYKADRSVEEEDEI